MIQNNDSYTCLDTKAGIFYFRPRHILSRNDPKVSLLPQHSAMHRKKNICITSLFTLSQMISTAFCCMLMKIRLATEEDKLYQLDCWASLFQSKTWKELRMIAENNEYMKESSKTIFQLSADELVQKRCRDREEYYDDIRSYQHISHDKGTSLWQKERP